MLFKAQKTVSRNGARPGIHAIIRNSGIVYIKKDHGVNERMVYPEIEKKVVKLVFQNVKYARKKQQGKQNRS
jgi:hypothetical protein